MLRVSRLIRRAALAALILLFSAPSWAAFGDLDQIANSGAAATTQTCSLSTPTSGDLLIFVSPSNSGGATISSAPSGWTELTFDNSGNFAAVWYYKISNGTETSVSITWSAGSGTALCAEYDFGGETLTEAVPTDEDITNVSTPVTSQAVGSVTPANSSTNIVLATVMGDSAFNIDGSPAWTNSPTVDQAIATQGSPYPALVRWVNQSGSTTSTYSVTDTGDDMYGAIADFSAEAGGSVIPVLHHQLRNQ